MRQARAWFLLSLIVLSWLGSCGLCLDVTYKLRLLYRMDAREAAIAHRLEEQLRQDFLVKVVHPDGSNLRGFVYSGDFLFSEGSGGDTVHYMLVDKNRASSVEKVAKPVDNGRDQTKHTVLLKDFFQVYIINETVLCYSAPAATKEPASFCSSAYRSPARSLPEPPPNRLA